jgi:hypothetical protein
MMKSGGLWLWRLGFRNRMAGQNNDPPCHLFKRNGYFFRTDIRLVPEMFLTDPLTPFLLIDFAASFISGWGTWRTRLGLPLAFSLLAALSRFWRLRSISVAVLLVAESSLLPPLIETSVFPGALALARLWLKVSDIFVFTSSHRYRLKSFRWDRWRSNFFSF